MQGHSGTSAASVSREAVFAVIEREIRKLAPDTGALSEATDLTTDVNIDSVSINDMIFGLEEEFDISIPLSQLADVYTIGSLITLVCSIKNKA